MSLVDFLRGTLLTNFLWNITVYSLTNLYNLVQLLSIVGTYTLNLFALTIFLIPSVFLLKIKLNKQLIIASLAIVFCFINYVYGSRAINNDQKNKLNNLQSIVKIM